MEKKSVADKLKMVFLLLYFLILTVERVISLVCVFTGDFSSYDVLDYYMTALTIVSLIGSYAYILLKCRIVVRRYDNGKVSASPELAVDTFKHLAVAAGIILLGGMVHTEGTIAPVQFAAYGMILISMAIHTAQCVKKCGGGFHRWISFSYIVAFSMAIPVVYHSSVELAWLFIPVEIIVSAGMVVLFTVMLKNFYTTTGEYAFPAIPFIAAIVGDAAVLALRWQEEINMFVLIFITLASVLWIVGKICVSKQK